MQLFFILFETQQQMECIDQMMESMGSCNEGEKRKDWFNSQAGGMAVARPYGFEIDFVRNPISGSAA